MKGFFVVGQEQDAETERGSPRRDLFPRRTNQAPRRGHKSPQKKNYRDEPRMSWL